MPSTSSPRLLLRLLAALLALTLVAGACGGGDDDSADPEGNGGSGGTSNGTGEESTAELPPVDDSEPTPGGTLVYALAGETDGWDPSGSQWAPSGLIVARTIFDTLSVFDEDGEVHPYLAESFEPNEGFDSWVITLRPDVTFHNGEELTAQVLKDNWDFYAESPLVQRIFEQIEDTEVIGDLELRVDLVNTWVNFPKAWTTQVGVVMAPEMLEATGEVRARNPIGTGPFRFAEWDQDRSLRVERNDDYWQEGFPYLSEIEFRVITDPTTRSASMRSGDIDAAALESAAELARFEDDDTVIIWKDPTAETAESFVMFNTMRPPFDDERVRRALAHATDAESINQVIHGGSRQIATGPYRPSSPWYEETDYPTFDLAEAQRLIAEYEADEGPVSITLDIGAAGADNQLTAQLLQEQWLQAGVKVDLGTAEVSTLILSVVTGNYQAVVWRQFDSPHPLQETVWWSEETAEELGQFGLNFARNRNATLTDALDAAREAETVEEEVEQYAIVQRELTNDIPYLWLNHVEPTFVASDRVANLFHAEIPDQPDVRMMSLHNSAHPLHQVWLR